MNLYKKPICYKMLYRASSYRAEKNNLKLKVLEVHTATYFFQHKLISKQADRCFTRHVKLPYTLSVLCGKLTHQWRRPGFDPGSVHVGFVVDKVARDQVFPRILRFSPVNFIPPVLHYLEK
jgi:hypothetical protein